VARLLWLFAQGLALKLIFLRFYASGSGCYLHGGASSGFV